MPLLRQNSELRGDRIWNWTLPASTTTMPDGRRINVCPAADTCVRLCYARTNTYQFPNVLAAHQRNLAYVLDSLDRWELQMIDELQARRFRSNGVARFPALIGKIDPDPWLRTWMNLGGAAVRIHDSGDFFRDDYTRSWLRIAETVPDVLFYAYTKEIPRFRKIVEPLAPSNFRWIYSMGGRYDYMIDRDVDRHADVFVNDEDLSANGYFNQSESDLLAILAPTTRIGIPANNIPHILKRMGDQSFGEAQAARKR